MSLFYKALVCLVGLILLVGTPSMARVQVEKYGDSILVDKQALEHKTQQSINDLLKQHRQFSQPRRIIAIERPRTMPSRTADFYILVFLCLALGIIKVSDPRYFNNLWRAFTNPSISARQLKDQLQAASVSSMLMNLFFVAVSGVYVFFVVRVFIPQRSGSLPPSMLLAMLIAGMGVIYLAKYVVIRSSGWAFKVEGITEHYLFNVFLINKILAITLLPFTIILAFADPQLTGPAVIISFILIGFLLINRYTRSWQIFGSFFQYSKFHFFTYLCASEVLPLAVLMKILVQGLQYY